MLKRSLLVVLVVTLCQLPLSASSAEQAANPLPEVTADPAAWKPLHVSDDAAAADRVHGRASLVIVFPPRLQQHHPDHAIARDRVGHHLAVPRFEDVERQEHVGEEHNVGEREEW